MRLGKVKHFLRYQISCSDDEWDTRKAAIRLLRENAYSIVEAPNPCRLHAFKDGEEFLVDIVGKNRVCVLPVNWAYGYTDKPILVTDIPSTGRYGIWNEESKYYAEISKLVDVLEGEERPRERDMRGITLIEVLIIVAIPGILAALIVPNLCRVLGW